MTARMHGLVAATHTPFDAEGRLNLSVVEGQAAHLHRNGVRTVFIGGTTGEAHSLSYAERRALAEKWVAVAKGTPLRIVLHVGANCLADARLLAEQARCCFPNELLYKQIVSSLMLKFLRYQSNYFGSFEYLYCLAHHLPSLEEESSSHSLNKSRGAGWFEFLDFLDVTLKPK